MDLKSISHEFYPIAEKVAKERKLDLVIWEIYQAMRLNLYTGEVYLELQYYTLNY
jgi:uncharacterized membrane protein